MLFDVTVDVESDDIDADLFEALLLELSAGQVESISVSYWWGVSVFMAIEDKTMLGALSKGLDVVGRSSAKIISVEAGFSE